MSSRRWLAIIVVVAAWVCYLMYLIFTEWGDDTALPRRIEDALARVLLVATLVIINADMLLWHLRRHRPASPAPAAAITAEIPRIRAGRVYASISMSSLAGRANGTAPNEGIDPSTMELMRRLDSELGQARGNSFGNTEHD